MRTEIFIFKFFYEEEKLYLEVGEPSVYKC